MISIIMPVYNTEPYLRSCLDSIRHQSFQDWELIAVDDFSTDQSVSVLTEYSDKDPRIRWMPNVKKGIISALQLAYDHSQGRFIHRMDSDDLMPFDKLQNLHTLLTHEGPGAVATGKVEYFSTTGKIRRGFSDYATWINRHVSQGDIFKDIFMECPIASPAWIMYRNDLEAIGGIVSGRYPEDYDLVFRMYLHGLKPTGRQDIVHLWRDWPDRASRTKKEYADQLFFDLKLYHFIDSKYHNDRPLALWGAGRKGKKLFKKIRDAGITVKWVTENEKKIGQNIYGLIIEDPATAICQNTQIIVAVSGPEGKEKIRSKLVRAGKKNNDDLFFFC